MLIYKRFFVITKKALLNFLYNQIQNLIIHIKLFFIMYLINRFIKF